MVFGFLISTVSLAAAFGMPLYRTLLAVEGKNTAQRSDWLQYWAVLSVLMLFLSTPVGALVAWILPFFVFESLKAGVCVWLWHEKTCGARIAVDLALPHYARVAPQIKVVTGFLDTAADAISKQVKAVGLPSE
eukprot:Rhum_TRINITY_DN3384_c0_g1::Rhum_TRINITY_DN3384_c0_g1_i1::g.10568::m.10568/K17279/REEP5_6; receptor expression-enhancing protein 5/6